MAMMKGPDRVGEVVESASHGFTAQCYRLYESPPLGALVRTEAPTSPNGVRARRKVHPTYTQLCPGSALRHLTRAGL